MFSRGHVRPLQFCHFQESRDLTLCFADANLRDALPVLHVAFKGSDGQIVDSGLELQELTQDGPILELSCQFMAEQFLELEDERDGVRWRCVLDAVDLDDAIDVRAEICARRVLEEGVKRLAAALRKVKRSKKVDQEEAEVPVKPIV